MRPSAKNADSMAQQPPYQGPPWQPTYPHWPYQQPPGDYPQPALPPPRYTPPPPTPTPESPEKRRRRIRLAVTIIVVGVLAQVVIVALNFGQVRQAAGTADVHAPLAPNSAGTFRQGAGLMKTRVTILNVSSNAFAPGSASGMKQIAIDVLIENTGRLSVNGEPWKVRGADGNEYDRVVATGVSNLPSRFRLSSGGQVQGTLVFPIPADTTVRWLRYGPHLPLNPNLSFDAP